MSKPAVFLDRDGVINRVVLKNGRPHPPQSLAAVEILPGVASAVATLKRAGFTIVVVTNQPDVARGAQNKSVVEAINSQLGKSLGIEYFRVCYHDDAENCMCRKPKPGLLIDAAKELGLDLARSFMVGDRWRDIEAGRGAGVKTIWLDMNYDETRPKEFNFRSDSLANAVDFILGQPLQPNG